MRKSILYAFLFVFLSFSLMSCSLGNNTVDETASNTTPDASIKELLSISAVSMGGKSYQFSPNINGASASELTYEWNFGDTESSTEPSPIHEYKSLGMKTVTLTTYKGGEIWKTTSTAINVTDAGSITGVDIIARPESDGINYTFTSRAAAADGGELEFTWNFDDDENNEISGKNLNNVTHSFTQYARNYNVTLTVKNPANNDEVTTKVAISTPTPTFSFDVNAGAIPGSKKFMPNLSIDIPDVTYTWYFDTSKLDNASYTKTTSKENPEAEFYYGTTSGKVTARCVVSSPKLANDIIKEVSNIDVGINFQLLAGSYETISQDQLTFKYSVKGAFQGDDASKINNVKYIFTFADGTSQEVAGSPVMDGGTEVAGQSQAEVTYTYSSYRQNYPVSVEAKDGEDSSLGVLSTGLTHNFVVPEYSISTTTNPNNPFNVTFNVVSSYTLKGVVYSWNVGDGTAVQQGESVTHTYSSNGTFPITLTVKTTLEGNSFINYTATSNVAISESIQNAVINCSQNGDNWLTYRCTTTATSSTGTLQYVWKVRNTQVGTGAVLDYTFDKYGGSYKVDLELKIQNTTISVNAPSVWVGTPTPEIEIEGNGSVISGTPTTYTIKVRADKYGEKKEITATNFRASWYVDGTYTGAYDNKQSIEHTFTVNSGSATKTLRAQIRGDNIEGLIDSATKSITVTKPEAGMEDIESISLTCRDDSAWNTVKKHCKANINLKSSASGTLDNFAISIYDDSNLNNITAENNKEVALILNWPDISVTGKSSSKPFNITAKVYKTDNPNNAMTKSITVNVSNYIYYVLFPMPQWNTEGGTGNILGVYSCGYNSFYSNGNGVIQKQGCTEQTAVSGNVGKGTFNLGALINDQYQATVRFRLVWGVKIYGQEKIIKETYVDKGAYVPDSMKTFDISSAFSGIQYAGSVYNSNDWNSMFFLRVTDAVSKPLTVWYNGNYITNSQYKNYKLEILAPIQAVYGHTCGYYVQGKTVYGENLGVKFESPYFGNGSGNLQLLFGGSYTTDTNQSRGIYGSGFANISGNTVGIKNLFYTEGDGTVKSITVNSVNITVTLKNSMSGSSTYEYKNVYKGITCYN